MRKLIFRENILLKFIVSIIMFPTLGLLLVYFVSLPAWVSILFSAPAITWYMLMSIKVVFDEDGVTIEKLHGFNKIKVAYSDIEHFTYECAVIPTHHHSFLIANTMNGKKYTVDLSHQGPQKTSTLFNFLLKKNMTILPNPDDKTNASRAIEYLVKYNGLRDNSREKIVKD